TVSGRAAHAGQEPEKGINANRELAFQVIAAEDLADGERGTTVNAGRIEGGTATNVVAEHCRVELEARSLDHDRAGDAVARIVDALTAGASDAECDVELIVEEEFRAYRLARSARPVQVAIAALEALGIEPRPLPTGGASDANVFQARGLPCLNVANGTERNHEPDEQVTVQALETMLEVALGLVAAAA
ncbi:MAG: M20/M25/M40 family metallo-hydrolase, partial [Actinobacteria bacterium]|nr:M20/M25/M40 family metallo-hydrolase [Actinomycetota bacterium]